MVLAGTGIPANASPTITSPTPGGPLNNNQTSEPSPVTCGFDPTDNGPFTFGTGLVGTAEPATSMSLPAGSSDYFYVGSDASGNPLTNTSWNPDGTTGAGSTNVPSIGTVVSIGESTSDSASYSSGGTTNAAIAGLGVTGYTVTDSAAGGGWPGTPLPLSVTADAGDLLLVVVGGDGVGLLHVGGASLSTLLNVTYSECGSNVIASVGMFAAFLPAGTTTVTISASTNSASTYQADNEPTIGAIAYVLAPGAAGLLQAAIGIAQQVQSAIASSAVYAIAAFGNELSALQRELTSALANAAITPPPTCTSMMSNSYAQLVTDFKTFLKDDATLRWQLVVNWNTVAAVIQDLGKVVFDLAELATYFWYCFWTSGPGPVDT